MKKVYMFENYTMKDRTCNELNTANRYSKTIVFSSTDRIPNTQVKPRTGSRAAIPRIPLLQHQ
jgi:hypothetical protein